MKKQKNQQAMEIKEMLVTVRSKKYISGLTLIEMLIGIVISTIIMGAMYTTYTVVNQSYSQVTNKAKISRSGRDIIEMLIRIRRDT